MLKAKKPFVVCAIFLIISGTDSIQKQYTDFKGTCLKILFQGLMYRTANKTAADQKRKEWKNEKKRGKERNTYACNGIVAIDGSIFNTDNGICVNGEAERQ